MFLLTKVARSATLNRRDYIKEGTQRQRRAPIFGSVRVQPAIELALF
jgi:hypothetical protein